MQAGRSDDAPPPPPPVASTALPRWLATTLVALSSAVVLILEIVAVRLVAPYVGLTIETYSTAIGVALLGIALGAAVGGVLADRLDPRRLIPPLLVLGGALVALARVVVDALGPGAGPGSGATLFLVTVAVAPAATLLSAVPPAVVKLQLRGLDETGRVVGRLSAVGTIGALAGVFLTGFVLLALLPTGLVLGLSGLAVGLLGLALVVLPSLRQPAPADDDDPLARADAPGLLGVSALAVALVAAGTVLLPSPCDTPSAYYCLSVETEDPDRPDRLTLRLDELRHAVVDLDDPTHLEFAYTTWFGAVVDEVLGDEPVEALHLGLGGGTIPRWLAATRPGSASRVLEVDEAVRDTAYDRLGLGEVPDVEVLVGDARVAVADEPDDAYDLVVGDAFGSRSVPWHLASEEFYAEVDRVLRDDGLLVVNVIDFPPNRLVAAQVATIREQFAHVALVGRPGALDGAGGGNFVVVAARDPLPLDGLTRALADVDPDKYAEVLDGSALDEFVDDAPVLSDEYAPTDQLLTPLP